jgi:Asp-tRNA(Asn)/Glu-tRNA(Gln) amidotransferase B subunit
LKHFIDNRIFEKDLLSFTVGTETEAVKISSSEFREALRSDDFDYSIEDLVVSSDKEVKQLENEGLDEQNAKFVAEKGYRKTFYTLQEDFDQQMVLKLLLEIDRHELSPQKDIMDEILSRAEGETHLQKLVEHLAEEDDLPEEQGFDLEKTIEEVIDENPEAVEDLKEGKDSSINYLIGQVMQQSQGRADADEVKQLIESRI